MHSLTILFIFYSPVKDTVVVNDRWGVNCRCKHGGYYTCQDKYNPRESLQALHAKFILCQILLYKPLMHYHIGVLQKHKWENALTIDRYSWGYRREAVLEDYLSIEELLQQLVITVR